MSIGKEIAVLGICGLIGFSLWQTKDTDVLWWLWILVLI